jgi:hypothetical protein
MIIRSVLSILKNPLVIAAICFAVALKLITQSQVTPGERSVKSDFKKFVSEVAQKDPQVANRLANFNEFERLGIVVDARIEKDFRKASGFALEKLSSKTLQEFRMWGFLYLLVSDGVLTKTEQTIMRTFLGDREAKRLLSFISSQKSDIPSKVKAKVEEFADLARTSDYQDRLDLLDTFKTVLDQSEANEQEYTETIIFLSECLGIRKS